MEPTTQPGTEARNDQVVLDAARAEGARLERQRVSGITALGASFNMEKLATTLIASGVSAEDARAGSPPRPRSAPSGSPWRSTPHQEFVDAMIDSGVTLADARAKIQEELVALAGRTVDGGRHDTQEHIAITATVGKPDSRACRKQSCSHRPDALPQRNARSAAAACGDGAGICRVQSDGDGPRGPQCGGISTRGMSKDMIAQKALNYRRLPEFIGMSGSYFGGGADPHRTSLDPGQRREQDAPAGVSGVPQTFRRSAGRRPPPTSSRSTAWLCTIWPSSLR